MRNHIVEIFTGENFYQVELANFVLQKYFAEFIFINNYGYKVTVSLNAINNTYRRNNLRMKIFTNESR